METIKGTYDVTVEYSKYVIDIIGSQPLIKNKIISPVTKLFNDDTMCQSLDPLPPSGIFSERNIVKFAGMTGGCYIIYRATKSISREINKRYIRAEHWFKVYEFSSTHPELYVLVEFHSLVSPFIYFHYLFKSTWSILRSVHKVRMHSENTNYELSRWRTLLKLTGIVFGSYVYWFGFTDWSAKQIFGRTLSFHSWATNKALHSIDIEEIRWKKSVKIILTEHFEAIDELSNVVIELVGNSEIFKVKEDALKTSNAMTTNNYSRDRKQEYRRKYTTQFKHKKCLISSLILTAQSITYLVLLYKSIKCEHNKCESYYDKLDDWHNQFDDKYDIDEKWFVQKWIDDKKVNVWKYLFVERRVPLSGYVIGIANYVNVVNDMDRDTKRWWRNLGFCGSLFGLWGWLNYAVVDEMIYGL